jgi:hypothetical protein
MWHNIFFAFVDLFYDLLEHHIISRDKHNSERDLLFLLSIVAMPFILLFGGKIISTYFSFQLFWDALYKLAPVWVPLVLLSVFTDKWFDYIRRDNIAKEGSVLLEVRIPKETNKSPLAMEIFFTALYQTGSVPYQDTYLKGKTRPWFSFELVSIDGVIHFYIWTWKKYRNLIESQLYAQYPNIEVYEAEDYSLKVQHDPVNMPMWGTYFTLTDPTVYPIKTYVDYGLDKLDTKEEYKIDPITSVLEFMGSMKKGEQIWIQILIQAHRKVGLKEGYLFEKGNWKDEILEEIEKIREDATPEREGENEFPGVPMLTKGQQEKIASLERSMSKFPFETSIRGFYIATKESFSNTRFAGLIGSFRQYNSNYSNGFKLGKFTDFDYPWQDFKRMRRNHLEHHFLHAYKARSFFQPPFKFYDQSPYILTTEELATIYHFPGSVAQTPTLARIPSKRVEPPSNLPI